MNDLADYLSSQNLTTPILALTALIFIIALGLFLYKKSRGPLRPKLSGPKDSTSEKPSSGTRVDISTGAPASAKLASLPMDEGLSLSQFPVQDLAAKKDLRGLLAKTRDAFAKKLDDLVLATKKMDESFVENLEELLYTSDLGPRTVQKLLLTVRAKLSRGELRDIHEVKSAFYNEISEILKSTEKQDSYGSEVNFAAAPTPWVILVVGVNGVGKTTSIGKLAHFFAAQQRKVLVVAGDTFRAAAGEQLTVWGDRANVDVFNSTKTTDPAAVAFEGIQKGVADKYEVIIIDTAGRLHTKENLMEELKKVKRVMTKVLPSSPNEVILVLDANSGQNALVQARQFHSAVGVTSLIVTKLDGTARGGIVVGIAEELSLGIQYVGLGEKITDLQKFSAVEFTKALLNL